MLGPSRAKKRNLQISEPLELLINPDRNRLGDHATPGKREGTEAQGRRSEFQQAAGCEPVSRVCVLVRTSTDGACGGESPRLDLTEVRAFVLQDRIQAA